MQYYESEWFCLRLNFQAKQRFWTDESICEYRLGTNKSAENKMQINNKGKSIEVTKCSSADLLNTRQIAIVG